ncbi:WhiB family transcriptional regulator [Jiangella rhizosphaerae]|uniref:Transcriptional regulator WhiB n=1 Tax=Jiangella rhizosphaerae TaxID=2293569 RepID=A0A418KXV1_9ACTN|nr:WhiB family transcriptional regulator [Jiangella rhizosphaerae]RIQ37442.1 WhiB family transcriptional regulator [Jiangella rhizosphaerae]
MRIVRRTETGRRSDVTVPSPDDPGARVDSASWWEYGLCRAWDADLFCVPDGVSPSRKRAQESKAKRICQMCPVREPCLDEAMARDEQYGVWGGLDTEERRQLERRRPGKPRPS